MVKRRYKLISDSRIAPPRPSKGSSSGRMRPGARDATHRTDKLLALDEELLRELRDKA
jgi:hypothetical protein